MPKIVDKDAMRVRIMGAAMETFVAHGFHAAKMTDIAKAAGMAKGTLYLYFTSKEVLTTSLVKWIFQDIEQKMMLRGQVQTLADYMEQIRRALDAPQEARGETRMFFEVLGPSFGSTEVVQEISAFFDRIGEYSADQLQHLVKIGEVRSDIDPQTIGRTVASMVDGMVTHRALFGLEDARYAAMLETTLDFIWRGLKSQ